MGYQHQTDTQVMDPADPPEAVPAPDEAPAAPSSISIEATIAGGTKLSPDAKDFIPNQNANDLIGRLPERHKSMLRGHFQDWHTGEWWPYYVGTLKSYNNRTGYGFIESTAAKTDWGADVFVHKNHVPMPWNLGQPVEFAVTVNSRGQPQATDLNWLPKLPEPKRPMAPNPHRQALAAEKAAATPSPTAATNGGAMPAVAVASAPPPSEQRWLGTLKSFSTAQGYGFMQCEAIYQKHNRDVYFDKSQLPTSGYRIGQIVEFSVSYNAKGHPQARNVKWDPIPSLPLTQQELSQMNPPATGNTATAGGVPAGSNGGAADGADGQTKSYAAKTTEKLQKLLKVLHESGTESALVAAIDHQGAQGNTNITPGGEDLADRCVDYVTFMLERVGPPTTTVSKIKDFVRMLLLLMLSKMLRRPFVDTKRDLILAWFEALSMEIDPAQQGVHSHFQDVVRQIDNHVDSAKKEHTGLFADEKPANIINSAVQLLHAKSTEVARPLPQKQADAMPIVISRPPGI